MCPYSFGLAPPPLVHVQQHRMLPIMTADTDTENLASDAADARLIVVRAVGKVTPEAVVCKQPSGNTTREIPLARDGSAVTV